MIEKIKITSTSGRGSIEMEQNSIGGYWLGPVDWGQVQGQHNTYRYYNQVGESIVSTSILSRPISITGWVVDGFRNSLQTRCDRLNSFFSPTDDYWLEFGERKIKFRPDSSIKYSRELKSNNKKIRKFLLQGTAPYPLFSGLNDTIVTFDSSSKLFRFPNNFGSMLPVVFGSINKAYNAQAYNPGGFETGLTVDIKFSGPVTNPKIKNLTTGKFIGVNRAFSDGEKLQISTMVGDKRMTLMTADSKQENLIKFRDYKTAWIQLVPGKNVLALDCDDLGQRNNMDVVVRFSPLYLEVE
jgi:hypothetical protein